MVLNIATIGLPYSISCKRIFFDQLSVFSISCKCDFFDQLCLIFHQLSVFSISCKRDFFDQLCLIFDQLFFFSISCKRCFFDQLLLDILSQFDHLSVFFFRSVVSVTFSISCALYSTSIRSFFCFSISCKRDFFDQLCLIFYQLSVFFEKVILTTNRKTDS